MKVFLCFSKGGFSVRNRPAPPVGELYTSYPIVARALGLVRARAKVSCIQVGERPLKRTKSLLWTNPHQPPLVKSSNFCRYDVSISSDLRCHRFL